MSLAREISWYLDADKTGGPNPLLDGKKSYTSSDRISLIEGNVLKLKLFFRRRGVAFAESTVVQLSAPVLKLGAKRSDKMDKSGSVFQVDEFVAAGDNDDLHYEGTLNLNVNSVHDAFESGEKSITVFVDIEHQNVGNTERCTWRVVATILRNAYTAGNPPSASEPPYPSASDIVVRTLSYIVPIDSGADRITMADLGLPSAPARVLYSIRKPGSESDNIFAILEDDTITADGFSFSLSATPPSAGYKLDVLVIL